MDITAHCIIVTSHTVVACMEIYALWQGRRYRDNCLMATRDLSTDQMWAREPAHIIMHAAFIAKAGLRMQRSMRELLGLTNLPKAKGSTESASSTTTIWPVMMHLLILIACGQWTSSLFMHVKYTVASSNMAMCSWLSIMPIPLFRCFSRPKVNLVL